jgi:hypothetical protein
MRMLVAVRRADYVAHPVAHLDRSTRKMNEPQAAELGFCVELKGIEPLTSSMPWKRSAN